MYFGMQIRFPNTHSAASNTAAVCYVLMTLWAIGATVNNKRSFMSITHF
jgi:hypothetical protein